MSNITQKVNDETIKMWREYVIPAL
jgi:hypothetical protein